MATQLKKTVKPSGGDYTSLEACMNANEQNLVTADKYFDVEIDGDWSGGPDTSAVTIHNYTTDATRYINIYCIGTARHAGPPIGSKSTAYRLYTDADVANSINLYPNYCTLRGLQIEPHSTVLGYAYGGIESFIASGAGSVVVDTCLLKFDTWASNQATELIGTYNAGSTTVNYRISNSVLQDATGSGIAMYGVYANKPNVSILNCTLHNCASGIGVDGAVTLVCTNNLFDNCTVCATVTSGTLTDTYCSTTMAQASSGLRTVAGGGTGNRFSQTFTYVAGTDNFHLASNDAGARDLGTDLSATFTTDVDGETRSGTWDIGADEYVAVGGATPINAAFGDSISSILSETIAALRPMKAIVGDDINV